MFIREVKKQRSKDSKVFFQYTLAQAVRIEGKVKQRAILYLGSDPLLKDKENRAIVLDILKSKIFKQPGLFPQNVRKDLYDLALNLYEKYCIKYNQDETSSPVSIPPPPEKAEFHNVDIKKLDIRDVKEYGSENLCKQVLDKLKLKECLLSLGMTEEQTKKSLISIAAKAIYSSSEYKTAQLLESNSELNEFFGYKKKITHKQLYAVSDMLYEHKSEIDKILYKQITDMFDIEDRLVIFDISNSYFETRKAGSKRAKHGVSKEKRHDCPIVVFTAVINSEGFIRHSRIYEGNKSDIKTLPDMLEDLEKHSSRSAKHTIVIDAGIADEENLSRIREKGYKYVCVSRKRIKDYPREVLTTENIQLTDRGKNKVKLSVFQPAGYSDTWMYVESEGKREKEESMNKKLRERFEEDLGSIKSSLSKKGGTKQIDKVWERIGRVKERHNRVSGRYEIRVEKEAMKATALSWRIKPDKVKDDKSKGVYFIRTNYRKPSEKELWDIYNTIREVESTFRSLKSDLNIRPIYHQKDDRIDAHLYLTMLAYQLVNTIRYMLKKNNINYSWSTIRRIMSTQKIQTVVLRTDKKEIHLRKPSEPIAEVKEIYSATNCKVTQPAVKKYVVYH